MEKTNMAAENDDLNLKATELRLGLPGTNESENDLLNSNARNNKRALPDSNEKTIDAKQIASASKAQIVGWPPVRSYRKNNMQITSKMESELSSATYVKVSMDGAPFLRKIDLKVYKKGGYSELLKALENMFNLTFSEYSEREGYKGSEYAPAYQDKDGDLMLVGDVPFEMFISTCKRLRIMKGAEARGLGCNI